MEVFNKRSLFSGFENGIIQKIRNLPTDSYYLLSKGQFIELDAIQPNDVFQINFRLLGGKGGFGSVLRSFRISKSTNKLMCRNLQGRRVGDVQEEERMRKWVAKKADREKEAKKKKKEKHEKLKQGGPKHQFADVEYMRKRDLVMDQTEDAFEAGASEATTSQADEPTTSKAAAAETKEPESSDDSDFEMGYISVSKKKKRKLQ